jgi:adenylate kinase
MVESKDKKHEIVSKDENYWRKFKEQLRESNFAYAKMIEANLELIKFSDKKISESKNAR